MSETRDNSFNQQLFQIVSDLWGNLRQDSGEASAPLPGTAPSAKPAGKAGEASKPKPKQQPKRQPSLEEIWQFTDESVDWTEVLTHPEPTDSASDASLWHLYHGIADRVLHGDTAAYQQALDAARPLDDLLPYAHGFEVRIPDADHVEASCEAEPSLLHPEQEERSRWYLSAIAVRVGRDLLALLPLQEVKVRVCRAGLPLLEVPFTRAQMQKVHFAFVDPIRYVTDCGGVFA